MNNVEIRDTMRLKRIYSYEVAEEMGMSESAFSRKLRKELSGEDKKKVLDAIHRIAGAVRKEELVDA